MLSYAEVKDLIKETHLSHHTEDVGEETWHVSSYSAKQPTDIIAHHRTQDNVNQQFLAIVGRQNVPKEGLLVAKLEYKGAPDAVRMKAHQILLWSALFERRKYRLAR